jgi:hypothetical protein
MQALQGQPQALMEHRLVCGGLSAGGHGLQLCPHPGLVIGQELQHTPGQAHGLAPWLLLVVVAHTQGPGLATPGPPSTVAMVLMLLQQQAAACRVPRPPIAGATLAALAPLPPPLLQVVSVTCTWQVGRSDFGV